MFDVVAFSAEAIIHTRYSDAAAATHETLSERLKSQFGFTETTLELKVATMHAPASAS